MKIVFTNLFCRGKPRVDIFRMAIMYYNWFQIQYNIIRSSIKHPFKGFTRTDCCIIYNGSTFPVFIYIIVLYFNIETHHVRIIYIIIIVEFDTC